MKVYFNGCSATFGDELEDPATQAWPHILSQHYGYDYFNDAVRGGSNPRIWARTIDNLDNYDKFYIQWTMASRFTLYDPSNQWEVNFTHMLENTDYKNKHYFINFGKYYFTYWNNPYQNYVQLLRQIVSLQNLFREKRKPYLMMMGPTKIAPPFNFDFSLPPREQFGEFIHPVINIDPIPDSMLDEWYNNIQRLISQIDLSTFMHHGKWALNSVSNRHANLPRGHGDPACHREWADIIIDYESQLNSIGKK